MATKVSVFQTVSTKYISPSSFKGARIKAKSASGIAIVRSYDHSLNVDGNHAKVAEELCVRLDWINDGYGDLIGGQNADGSYTWILSGSLHNVS